MIEKNRKHLPDIGKKHAKVLVKIKQAHKHSPTAFKG